MINNFETCFLFKLMVMSAKPLRSGSTIFFAFQANDVRVRIWLVAIIPVASFGESHSRTSLSSLRSVNGFVNGSKACCWKIRFDLLINRFHGWMLNARSQNLQNRNPLRGDSELMLFNFLSMLSTRI